MEKNNATSIFESLASSIRLDVFRLLVKKGQDGMVAGEIATTLNVPPTNLSFHLKALTQTCLLMVAQEGRFQRYRANIPLMLDLIAYLTEECCAEHPEQCVEMREASMCFETVFPPKNLISHNINEVYMQDKIFTVLFLCTGNSARSIMAEAILNHLGKGRFQAYSAGSTPTGVVNPLSLKQLKKEGIALENARSKSWHEFAQPESPKLDFVITVCDNAAGEVCPVWAGQPITAHWGVFDPAAVEEEQKNIAFAQAFAILHRRISLFSSLNLSSLNDLALKQSVREIGLIN
jgi:arsenate reductase